MQEKNSDNIIFSELQRRIADQFHSVQTLDTKAALTLTFIGAIIAGLVNSQWFLSLNFWYHLALLLSLSVAALLALLTVLPRGYRGDPDPNGLIRGYTGKSEKATKGQLILNYQESFNKNAMVINRKSNVLNSAFIALALTVVIMAVSILFSLHQVTVK